MQNLIESSQFQYLLNVAILKNNITNVQWLSNGKRLQTTEMIKMEVPDTQIIKYYTTEYIKKFAKREHSLWTVLE